MVCDIRRAIENQVREPFSESRQMGLWRTAYRNQHVEEESSHGRRGGRTVFQLFASSTQSLSIHRIPFLHYLSAQREHSLLMNALLCFLGQCSILTTPTAIRDASTSSGSILLKRIAPNTLFFIEALPHISTNRTQCRRKASESGTITKRRVRWGDGEDNVQ